MRHVPLLVARSAVVVAVVLALCGCLNTEPQTSSTDQLQTSTGTNLDTGELAVRNLLVIVGPDGSAQLTGAVYNAAAESDKIASVTVNGTSATTAGDTELKPKTQTVLGPDGVQVTTPATELKPGLVTEVVMSFGSAPEVRGQVLIMSAASASAQVTS